MLATLEVDVVGAGEVAAVGRDNLELATNGCRGISVVATAATGKVNVASAVKVEIKPGPGYHMNVDFPISLKLAPNPDVKHPGKLDKSSPGVKVAEQSATFEVPLTPSKAGKQVVTGSLAFAVCTATSCDPQKAPVTLSVDVK